jgi:prepilin-type processing-associated H-X9-DG protein
MRRSGFTLVELLVITGILVILIALLIPYLHRSRLQANATVCSSNLRQLSIALFTYAADDGKFPYGFYSQPGLQPPEDGYAGIQQYDRKGWWWFNYLEGLYTKSMGKRTILQCPSKNLPDIKLESDILCGNYGVNLSICKMSSGIANEEFIGKPPASSEVTRPSQTLLLLDSGYAIISWWHAADEPPAPLGNSTIEETAYVPGLKINKGRLFWPGSGQNYDASFGRHSSKTVNVGYVDGHVVRIKADDLLVEKSSEGYKNLVPLWRYK